MFNMWTNTVAISQDVGNNTYTCLRTLNPDENSIYCYFIDSEDFVEVYDLSGDPYQLENKAATVSLELLVKRKNVWLIGQRRQDLLGGNRHGGHNG